MSLWALFSIGLRASFVFAFALVLQLPARRASAALRRWLLLLALGASLALPLLALPVAGRLTVHVSAPMRTAHVWAEALSARSIPNTQSAPRGASVAPVAEPWPARTWLLFGWAVGAALVAARGIGSAVRARRLLARARAQGALRVSGELESPAIVGVFRPVVVLPLSSEGWSPERLRAVLLHESAHLKHRDGLALLVAQTACALYWFQPLTWWVARRLRRECELAADEAVISAGMRATTYAQHLLAIARGMRVPAVGIAMASRPSELARRVHALVGRNRLPAPLTRRRAVLLGVAAAAVLALVACADAAPVVRSPQAAATPRAAPAIDPRLQRIADDEASKVATEWGARRVSIVVLDARNNTLLASHDDAPGQPIAPASTLKPLTVAIALDANLITPEEQFDCGNGSRAYGTAILRDAGEYGRLDAAQILAVSSNIGVSRIFDVLGGARLADGFRRFHVELPASIPDGSMRGAIVAMGEGSLTTPLALASAYAVFANDGVYATAGSAQTERVIKRSTAQAVRGMLEGVVDGERATGRAAQISGVRVGGKTGTSDDPDCEACAHAPGVFASFVGIVPLDRPRWVIYVGVGQPSKEGSGGTIAAPAFARIAARALALAP
jgi:beta-lactamase regulating signal transducer with metallopeptidase domain